MGDFFVFLSALAKQALLQALVERGLAAACKCACFSVGVFVETKIIKYVLIQIARSSKKLLTE